MSKIGRNDPCHCGSGKKYKHCHMESDGHKASKSKGFLIGGLILVFVVIAVILLFVDLKETTNRPQGPAPEGKVWSEEHGHWHNE
ncbi:MAG: SEC-C metal-binding domain-containing protein [Fulvivirga sp.]|nr:SEC-C metal-binding domain-containing protein [Fulvivirga sp.]